MAAAAPTTRDERLALGLYLLAVATGAASLLAGTTFDGPRGTLDPDPAQARVLQVVALLVLLAGGWLAVRGFGAGPALRMLGREAWPGLLTGAFLGLVVGAPLRALLPDGAFWAGVLVVDLVGLVVVRWFAHRVPPDRG